MNNDSERAPKKNQIVELMKRYWKPMAMAGAIGGGMAVYAYTSSSSCPPDPACLPNYRWNPATGSCLHC